MMGRAHPSRGERAGTDLPATGSPQAGRGALDELRAATAQCHRRLEKRLDIAQRFGSRDTYRNYLEQMFGYYHPVEQALSRHPVRRVLGDFQKRPKAGLLAADLRVLGATSEEIGALRLCSRLPGWEDEAAALGVLYVLEGATLGGQVLLRVVEQRLQLDMRSGASYLASYGADVLFMWQRFCRTVEDWCADGARRAIAASAAVATFESLEQWLCADPV